MTKDLTLSLSSVSEAEAPYETPSMTDRAPTAPEPGPHGWAEDFLARVPFERINATLIKGCCDLLVALTRDTEASAAVLRSLPRYERYDPGEEAVVLARIDEGDASVIADEAQFFDQQEIAAPLTLLYAYARAGEGPGRSPEESRAEIPKLIENIGSLVSMTPELFRRRMGDDFAWLTDTRAAAQARWAIDNNLPVSPEGLVALGGVKPKTIANLLAAKAVLTDAEGLIPAASAEAWLRGRKDFIPSCWQTWHAEPPDPEGGGGAPLQGPQMFVPVDGEGNPFLPSLARRSREGGLRYSIGEKSAPEYVEDYWEALDRLARMSVPRWRRPNAQGAWGLVTAQEGWRRYARSDLERMIEAVHGPKGGV